MYLLNSKNYWKIINLNDTYYIFFSRHTYIFFYLILPLYSHETVTRKLKIRLT